MTEVVPYSLRFFRRTRIYGGSASRKLARVMSGRTGAICDIRIPPVGLRNVSVDWHAWPVHSVEFATLERRRVRSYFEPIGVILEPGLYHLWLLDSGGHIVQSRTFQVQRDFVTHVVAFPPSSFLVPSRLVREMSTIEVETIPAQTSTR
jgi:hypothetical protein